MRRGAAALLVAAALAGCGGSEPTEPSPAPTATATPSPAPTDEELLQAALDRRAAGLARRPPRGLGVRDVSLQAEGVQVAGDRAVVQVRLGYRIAGLGGRFGGVREVTARRTGDGWRLGALPRRALAPWEVDDYATVSSPHFVVWVPAGIDPAALTAALEDGYARLAAILREGRLRRRYLVVVARDAGAARRLTGSIRGLDGLVALTDTEVHQAGEELRVLEVASQRLLVIWPAFAAIDLEARRIAVTHELTHAALAPVTSGRTPGWLTEGLALYVSGDDRAVEAATLGGPGLRRLSRPDAVARLSGDAQRQAYALASAAAFTIAERYGRERLLRLYLAFNRPGLRGTSGDPALTDAAVRRVLGTSLAALERAVRARL